MSGLVPPLSKHLRVLHLETVRSKILVFALLVTLIPSGLTAWISYTQNRRALEEKISQELLSSSGQAAREMDVWLKERLYDLRVFASSYEVSENFTRKQAGSRSIRMRWRSKFRGRRAARMTEDERVRRRRAER